jgi:hypothetical protein
MINAWNTEYTELINAQRAKSTYAYKDTKEKLNKINAAIWFNKKWRLNHATPKYMNITIKEVAM